MKSLNRKQYANCWLIVLWMSMTFLGFSQIKSTSNIQSLEWNYIPQNISVSTEIEKDFAIVNYILPTVNDTTGVLIKQINGFVSGAKIPIGGFLYEFTASDSLGNEITCSFSVIVNDEEMPIIIDCPNDIITNPDSGNCEKVVVYDLPSFADNSSIIDTEILPGDILFTGVRCDSPDSISFVTLKTLLPGTELHITDKGWLAGNEFRSGEDITTWKTTELVEAGSEIIISGLNTNIGECSGNSLSLSASGDQLFLFVGEIPTESNSSNFICGIQLNSSAGSTINSWDGDATSTTTTAKPSAIIPGFNGLKFSPERDNIVYSGSKIESVSLLRSLISDPSNWRTSNTGELIVSGNKLSIIEPELIKEFGQESGSSFHAGVTELKYSVTDFSNNKNECSFYIEIIDTTKPVFENIDDIYVNTNSDNCTAIVSYNLPAATDVCGELSYEIVESSVIGNEFPVGVSTVKVRASDLSGNYAIKDFNIIVEDKTPPEFIAVPDLTTMNETGKGPVIIHYDVPVGIDNCSNVTVMQIAGLGSGAEFQPGITVEKYQAIDGSGNISTTSFNVIVKENNRPEIFIDKRIEFYEDNSFIVECKIADDDTQDQLKLGYVLFDQNINIVDWQNNNNDIKFTIKPVENFNGLTKIKLQICDNTNSPNESNSCEVDISIIPIEDPPEIKLKEILQLDEGDSISVSLNLFEISDVDSPYEKLKLHFDKTPSQGEIIFKEKKLEIKDSIKLVELRNETLSYFHNASEEPIDSIIIYISDESTRSNNVTIPIAIKPINDQPTLSKIKRFIINEDSLLKLNYKFFRDYISDNDNKFEELNVIVSGSENISVVNNDNESTFLFEPKLNWYGLTKCKLTVNDGIAEVYQYIEILVKAVNDPPEFLFYPEQLIFDHGSFVELNLYSMIDDVETACSDLLFEFNTGDSITTKFDKSTGELILNTLKNFSGQSELRIKITDEEGVSAQIQIDVIVNNITDIQNQKIPRQYKLYDPFPNPFNSTTQFLYDVSESCEVTIKILDLLGREIKLLVQEGKEKGKYKMGFNAANLSSGVYFLIMQTINYYEVKKLIIIK